MAKNETVKNFYTNSTWTAPAGIKNVVVSTKRNAKSIFSGGFIDPYGNAVAIGLNTNGQLGDGTVVPKSSPVAVLGGIAFKTVKSGNINNASTYGLSTLGALYGWGQNANGELGLGDVTPRSSPVAVLGAFSFIDFISIPSSANASIMAMAQNGALYSFGANTHGELGLGDVTPRSSPVAVLGSLTFGSVVGVDSNGGSYFGITKAGVAYAWGGNANGQLGVGDVTPRSSPVAVLGGFTFSKIVGAGNNNCTVLGLTTAGVLYSWGANANGRGGTSNSTPHSSPVAVSGGLTFRDVWTSTFGCTFAVTTSGVLYSWGVNTNGQLGLGDTTNRSSPNAVLVLGSLNIVKVAFPNEANSGSVRSVIALADTGDAYGWGSNTNGVLGVGDVTVRSSPVAVVGGLKFVDLWPGNNTGGGSEQTIYGIAQDGTIYGWGMNTNGQLGIGDVNPRSSPVAVLGNRFADPNPITKTQVFPVIPGTSYSINMNQYNASFGGNIIGQQVDIVTLRY